MKKKKIIFLIIFIIIIIGVVPTINFLLQDKDIQALNISNERKVEDNLNHTNQRLIKVKGILYYDTGQVSEIPVRCGVMDGQITSHIDSKYIPTENNQSNFEGDYSYQQGLYGTIDVVIDGKWITFKPVN